jgi:hypothetical protein
MKRAAEETIDVPTLGQVAADEDFALLREIIRPVANRPVTELSNEFRGVLRQKGGDQAELLLEAFFAACDARASDVGLKRANIEKSSGEPKTLPCHALCDKAVAFFPFFFFFVSSCRYQVFKHFQFVVMNELVFSLTQSRRSREA